MRNWLRAQWLNALLVATVGACWFALWTGICYVLIVLLQAARVLR